MKSFTFLLIIFIGFLNPLKAQEKDTLFTDNISISDINTLVRPINHWWFNPLSSDHEFTCAIYNLDVATIYPSIKDKYNTELKMSVYQRGKEYDSLVNKLAKHKNILQNRLHTIILGNSTYSENEKDLLATSYEVGSLDGIERKREDLDNMSAQWIIKGSYDLRLKGFTMILDEELTPNYSIDLSYLPWLNESSLILEMNETLGLEFEENINDLKALIIFKLEEYEPSDSKFLTSAAQIIVFNRKTSKVLFRKNYFKEPDPINSNNRTDANANSILDKLQGKWQSTEDKTNYLIFDNNHRREIAGGIKEWDDEVFVISDMCQNDRDKDKGIGRDENRYISITGSDMCWYIIDVDATTLSLSYVGRGNTLTYKRVK